MVLLSYSIAYFVHFDVVVVVVYCIAYFIHFDVVVVNLVVRATRI